MDEKKIYQIFDQIGKNNIPESVNVFPAVQKTLKGRKAQSQRGWSMTYSRQMASVLIGVVLMVGAVYAITQQTIGDPALDETMLTTLDQSQTSEDVTVALEWGYADVNRIVVAYRVTAPTELDDLYNLRLATRDGHVFNPMPMIFRDVDDAGNLIFNAHYNADTLLAYSESLDLVFTLWDEFSFEFTIPFYTGHRVENLPDVRHADLNIELDWAVIAPSMTRVWLCYETPDKYNIWVANVELAFDGERVAQEIGASHPDYGRYQRTDGRWCQSHIFLTAYEQLPDVVTFTVTSLQTPHIYSEENMRRASEIYATYGIEAVVMRNEASGQESYLLSFPNWYNSEPDVRKQAQEDATNNMGDPVSGERINGPWVIEFEIP